MVKQFFIVLLVLLSISATFFIVNDNALAKESNISTLDKDFLKNRIKTKLGLNVEKIQETMMPGMALLLTNQGIFYATYNGDYFIEGSVYSVGDEVTNMGEEALAKIRLNGIKRFENDMIVYPAKNEKHVVTAFTDITCGYCRKMHKQMADYNARGITFRYLAFPRTGVKDKFGNFTDSFKSLRSVWCSDNAAQAMTKAKKDEAIPYLVCDKPIEAQLNFGRQIGVKGTPAIILENGMMIPGYQPPENLEKILKSL